MLKIARISEAIGFCLMFFGMCCMDSEKLLIPFLISALGCLILGICAYVENQYVEY